MSDIVIGYVIAAIVGLVVFAAWLMDFLEVKEIHLRPYLEKKINQKGDE